MRWSKIIEPRHEISNNVVCEISKASDQPAHTRNLIRTFACRFEHSMNVELLDRAVFGDYNFKGRLHRLV